jgi:hypothetical protein
VPAGLLAGVLDLAVALGLAAVRGSGPLLVLQFIASGVLGPSSFQQGKGSAALGVALHFVIAMGAAAVFGLASRRMTFLVRHPVPWGAAYGVAVYFFMNMVVLPLSRVPQRRFTPSLAMIAIHIVCVGVPIALVIRRRRV